VAVRAHPLGDRSVVLAVDSRMPISGPGPCCGETRVSAGLGFAAIPLRDRSRLGYEAVLSGGFARFRDGDAVISGPGAGLQVAGPIRLGSGRTLWESDDFGDFFLALVPHVGGTVLFPTDGLDRKPRLELSAGLALRLQFWTELMP
jgi:hypothetical protein